MRRLFPEASVSTWLPHSSTRVASVLEVPGDQEPRTAEPIVEHLGFAAVVHVAFRTDLGLCQNHLHRLKAGHSALNGVNRFALHQLQIGTIEKRPNGESKTRSPWCPGASWLWVQGKHDMIDARLGPPKRFRMSMKASWNIPDAIEGHQDHGHSVVPESGGLNQQGIVNAPSPVGVLLKPAIHTASKRPLPLASV